MPEFLHPSRDIENGTNASNSMPMPVLSFASGEGSPYAPPNDWPELGDRWVWKTGKRKGHQGYWKDRCLQPPIRLNGAGFRSKKSVMEFIERELPDTSVETFFSLFHWRIPCIEQSQTNANHKQGRKRSGPGSSSRAESDLPHPSDPEDDSGDSEMSTGQGTSSTISTPVQAPTLVNSVAGHAFSTSQEDLLSMEIELPAVIHRFLTSALEKLTNELDSTRPEALGDKMEYFNYHVAWFAHLKFPVEKFKQNLNSTQRWYQEQMARRREIEADLSKINKEVNSTWYQEQMARRRELEAELSKIDKEVIEYKQKIFELQQTAEKLQQENQSLFSETNRRDRNSSRPGSSSQGNSQPELAIICVEFSGSLPTSQQLVEFPIVIDQALAAAAAHLTNELSWTPLGFLSDRMGYFQKHIEWFQRFKFPAENLISIYASCQRQFTRIEEIRVERNQCNEKLLEYDQLKSKLFEVFSELSKEEETILSKATGISQI